MTRGILPSVTGKAKARIDIRIRRLYFIKQGKSVVILLAGGDKSSQDQDIRLAKDLARNL
jgi:putative addiction module killer protein